MRSSSSLLPQYPRLELRPLRCFREDARWSLRMPAESTAGVTETASFDAAQPIAAGGGYGIDRASGDPDGLGSRKMGDELGRAREPCGYENERDHPRPPGEAKLGGPEIRQRCTHL